MHHRLFICALLILFSCTIPVRAASLPVGFSEIQIAGGLDPTTMAFAPDGRLFVCEKPGRVRVVTWNGSVGTLLPTPFVNLSAQVNSTNERGLMSVCFDPQFGDGSGNDWVYLHYTAGSPTVHNRVSRFLASGNVATGAEDTIIDLDPGSEIHNGGAIGFGKDGKLYIGTGDGGANANAQSTASLLGKLLRLNRDGTIPANNPYVGSLTGNFQAIVGLGMRNPYTLGIASGTGLLYLNDVGFSNWEEINSYDTDIAAGGTPQVANYGWDVVEGPLAGQTPPANYRAPVHVYDHSVGTAICGGTFYDASPLRTAFFGASYSGRYFFCDYGGYTNESGKIMSIDPANPAARVEFATAVRRPICIRAAPDGALWYVARGNIVNGTGGSPADNGSVGTGGSIWRIFPNGGTATALTFVQQPTAANASSAISPAVTIAVQDAGGATVNSSATVTIALAPGSGSLGGTVSVAAMGGIATFANLSVGAPGSYTLIAISAGLTSATSSAFSITGTVNTPVIAPGTGSFSGPVWVQLSTTTPGATIRYTADGGTPDGTSPVYGAPFLCSATTAVKAFAQKSGFSDSPQASATMTVAGATPYGLLTRPMVSGVAMPPLVTGPLPATLAATNLFADLGTLAPHPGIIPYDINSPLWSDGAHKQRWIALPGTARAAFAASGEYIWPGGTIFVKHFELTVNEATNVRRRLETRVLVLDSAGSNGYGVTYRWNTAGSEATLVAAEGEDETISIAQAGGGTRTQSWRYPSRGQCLQCHTQNAGFVLGPKTRQLNGTYAYPGGASDNQLRTWNYLRMFTSDIGEGNIAGYAKLVPVDAAGQPLELRVRSYLDANCANCHRPGGAPASWDARYDTTLESQGIVDGPLANNLGMPAARVVVPKDTSLSAVHQRMTSHDATRRMPPLARNVVDTAAANAIAQWIATLPNGSGLLAGYWNQYKGTAGSPVLSRTDGPVDFNWGTGSPGAGVNADTFTTRWTGWVVPSRSAAYTLSLTSDDGSRMWFDGNLLIDSWMEQPVTETFGTTAVLTAGQAYPVTIEYLESTGQASVRLQWTSAGVPKAVVPRYRLFPTADAAGIGGGPPPAAPAAPGVSGQGSAAPVMSGTGTAGDTIHILDGATEIGTTTVQGDGTWSYTLPGLSAGSHQISAVASNGNGGSGPSASTTVAVAPPSGGGVSSGVSADSGGSGCGLGGGVATLALLGLALWLRLRLVPRRRD